MIPEWFIKELSIDNIPYRIEGDRLIITHSTKNRDIYLTSIVPNVTFENEGVVKINWSGTLPKGLVFNNKEVIYLNTGEPIPTDIRFNNGANLWLDYTDTIPSGVDFSNVAIVFFKGFNTRDSAVFQIDSISPMRVLDLMCNRL